MKILKDCYLAEIITELFAGKTIIYPTETSYGLGCDATSQEAVNRIFDIKGRSEDKPLLIIVPTIEMARKFLVWNNTIEQLASSYWPGPLTIIGKYNTPPTPLIRGEVLAQGVVSKSGTVAVRVTASSIAKFLSESLGRPLVATSGNISGAGDVYSADFAAQMRPIIHELKAEGFTTIRAICAELNSRQIPTFRNDGQQWHIQSVHTLLQRIISE